MAEAGLGKGANPGPEGPRNELRYLDVGWKMLGSVTAGVLGGWLVRRWIHADWPLAVGGMLGVALALYELIWMASNLEKKR
ncbi:MAG: hypothetical protein ACYCWW_12890 [Deltaproteobacteria bacterium]